MLTTLKFSLEALRIFPTRKSIKPRKCGYPRKLADPLTGVRPGNTGEEALTTLVVEDLSLSLMFNPTPSGYPIIKTPPTKQTHVYTHPPP